MKGEILGFLQPSKIQVNNITTNTVLETKIILQNEGYSSDSASEIKEGNYEKEGHYFFG